MINADSTGAQHERVALQFSGGKDSTALLYLARPWLDRITVIFAESGATFPHVVEHIERTCAKLGARLEIVRPPADVFAFTAEHGLPSDIVPVETSAETQPFRNPAAPELLQSYMRCCAAMLWVPMGRWIERNDITLVLRGAKRSDKRVGAGPNFEVEGITFRSPLWEWNDDRVFEYLRAEDVELPAHYPDLPDSLDCWCCTAHLPYHGDAKMRYIREHYPDLWPIVRERMERVYVALGTELKRIEPAFSQARLNG
jgi:3'-phosphoadenosine 5'-phosphosulfate sulfotransferase (PAPS reductase)/FAD synthetase